MKSQEKRRDQLTRYRLGKRGEVLASGLILFETSQIIHGGETNYIMATVSLYVSIYNLFVSLLSLLGFANSD